MWPLYRPIGHVHNYFILELLQGKFSVVVRPNRNENDIGTCSQRLGHKVDAILFGNQLSATGEISLLVRHLKSLQLCYFYQIRDV